MVLWVDWAQPGGSHPGFSCVWHLGWHSWDSCGLQTSHSRVTSQQLDCIQEGSGLDETQVGGAMFSPEGPELLAKAGSQAAQTERSQAAEGRRLSV